MADNENEESKLDPIAEIVGLEQVVQRNYDSLSRRLARLERDSAGGADEDFLSGKLIGFMLVMAIAPIALEMVAEMVRSWRSSS
jgi:hypothetical protein